MVSGYIASNGHRSMIPLLLTLLILTSCGDGTLQEGEASWYGPGFHGERTSSGEIYDQNEKTAAHRTLPFDTVVEVINTDTGESVEVRINDRGPYAENRIIDLSRVAAEELDMMDSGVAPVELKLVEAGGNIPRNLDQEMYTIQVAEYNSPQYAEPFVEDMDGPARIEQVFMFNRSRYFVYYGTYTSQREANNDLEKLREQGYDGFVKQIN